MNTEIKNHLYKNPYISKLTSPPISSPDHLRRRLSRPRHPAEEPNIAVDHWGVKDRTAVWNKEVTLHSEKSWCFFVFFFEIVLDEKPGGTVFQA